MRPNAFTFWSANFQIKLAPLILYTTLVYTSTLKSTVQKIFQISVILIKKLLLLKETAKLLSESRRIAEQGKESDDITNLLNLILKVVTTVDNRV